MTKISNQYSLTNILTADLANSRLGINNVSPTVALDVTGAGKFSSSVNVQNFLTVSGATTLVAPTSGKSIEMVYRLDGANDYAFIQAYDRTASVLKRLDLNASMTILPSGNVGIGTTTPTYNLQINSSGTSSIIHLTNSTTGALTSDGGLLLQSGLDMTFTNREAGRMSFETSNTERMRITSGGNVLIGTSTDYGYKISLANSTASDTGGQILMVNSGAVGTHYFFNAANTTMNTQDASLWMRRNGTTSRSINASGTINASGADYAEYMVKEITDDIAKGDIVGVNSNGKLTNIFADSVSFVIKSTDPSYVGGDTWFNVEPPLEKDFKSKNEFEIAYEEFKVKREEARAKVDRIAFSGQIPCNVLGANVGDYIIPINDNGKIKGQAISNPTFEQYQNSIAKVWKIMEDGRAWVAVKIG